MKNYIVTKEEFDLKLLMQLIPVELLLESKIINAGSYSSALSLTRSLLEKPETKHSMIFLILDAETGDEDRIDEKKAFINQYIGTTENVTVILFKPEIETVFFESIDLISRVVGSNISNLDLEVGKLYPRDGLKRLGITKNSLLEGLNENDKHLILNHTCFIDLINGLNMPPFGLVCA